MSTLIMQSARLNSMKPIPAHVAGQVVDFVASLRDLVAGVLQLEIQHVVLRALVDLIPLVEFLDVRDHHLVPLGQQGLRQVAADEASASRNEYSFLIFRHGFS